MKGNRKRTIVRSLLAALVLAIAVGAAGTLWIRGRLTASLPILGGEVTVSGLSAQVTVERDANGVPVIHGRNRADVARALGFLHGQERFFQMDLLRRAGAGELAELFGAAVVSADKRMRIHRFRGVARKSVLGLDPHERELFEQYAEGVNAGLDALGAKPPEYYAMRSEPAPWLVEDSLLVMLAMYDILQGDDGRRESHTGLASDLLPEPLYAFLASRGDAWDAPIVGKPFVVPDIPGPEVLDLRVGGEQSRSIPVHGLYDESSLAIVGSNNWAVAGKHTESGAALVANDMHLGLSLPNVWYRASLAWDEGVAGRPHSITGVTLAGMPGIVVGSNGSIAWGFTNSQGDWKDLVVIEVDPEDPQRYRTPDGWRPFEIDEQAIHVRDGEDVTLEVRSTIWGPIVDRDHLDRPRALRWIAHDPIEEGARFLDVETARDLEEAMDAANRAPIPTQNFTVGASTGRIGWTLMGPMPRRFGFDGRLPTSWADGTRGWDGHRTPGEYPRLLDPEDGRIWTANNRVVDGEMLALMGEGGYAGGARAGQIRDDLFALERATPEKMLAIQLDERALFLERWRSLLMQTLTDEAIGDDARRREFARFVRDDWSGHASVDSVGYRLVRAWRTFLAERVFAPLVQPCTEVDENFDVRWIGRWEGPLWKLVEERPAHLLDPAYASWDELFIAVVDATADYFLEAEEATLADATWGARNTVRIQHPISLAVPQLSRWLDAAAVPLPGDSSMPRVQSPRFGASERMAVPVGHEENGLFHMPGGQSGHPFSPSYLAGHRDWVEGRPTPFLPGAPKWRLTLRP